MSPKIKHQHRIEGINSRLDGIQDAILDVKLKHVLKWTQQRMQNAGLYNQHLSGIDELETPRVRSGVTHNFHLYVIKAEHRNELKVFLQNQGIETALHYPAPLPFLEAYAYLGHQVSDFPVVAENAHKILSLPMFPELQEEQIRYVSEQIKSFYRS